MNLRPRSLIFLAALLQAPPAWATGSMVVDNASIVDYDKYQVESWLLIQGDGWQFWQLPAVQAVHNLEVTVGATQLRRPDGSFGQNLLVQGKGLFRPVTPNSWGVGLSSGTVLGLGGKDHGVTPGAYINLPFSVSYADDRYLLHLNAGWAFDPTQDQPHAATWGVGGEYAPFPFLSLVGETFGSTRLAPAVQVGVRAWLVPDHFDLMATVGEDADGLRITTGLGYYQ